MVSVVEPYRPRDYKLYRFFWGAVDWLYPPRCAGCERPGVRWCSDCQSRCERITGPVCEVCGEPYDLGNLCHSCQASPPLYTASRSWGIFSGPLREALHRLKYQQDLGVGEALSKHMIELLDELSWPVQLIIPVPLSKQRRRERGYNQAGLLARPLALAAGLPCRPNALRRTRDTRSQVGLNEKERQQNVMGAFEADPEEVRGKIVLVVDDVATTGSTVNGCAQALLQSGAAAVYGMTLAKAAHRNNSLASTSTRPS